MTTQEKTKLLATLQSRFEKNMHRHVDISWADLLPKLSDDKLWSISEMERTGGEPDVVCLVENSNDFVFCDCAKESPDGRRSVCYDQAALESRKKFKPADSALAMAEVMGISMTTEEQYHQLQAIENFDTKTSSWIRTSEAMRSLGGALFGDYRFGRTFIYHNGAESYYAGRSFRGVLIL